MTRQVLLIDDDAMVREALAQTLQLAGLTPDCAASFVAAKDRIHPGYEGVILSDIRMPGRDGFHVLAHARAQDPDLPVIFLTGEGDIPMAVRAMGEGAFDFLEKPCAPSELTAVLERALRTRRLVLENRRLKAQLKQGDPAARMIFGRSALAEGLRDQVRLAAQAAAEVLVRGAPGSGISKVAEVVHLSSARARAPFVKRAAAGLDRAALAQAFAEAGEGSLFLDEVQRLPSDSQLALIDLLERGPGARLIAGTSVEVTALGREGALHADLFYRLQVLEVRIPALSERPEDIPVLFEHYLAQACEQAGLARPEVPPDFLARLMTREWPGNARALMSAAMRFALGLPDDGGSAAGPGLAAQMAQVERALLSEALRRHQGRASAAAAALKLPRKTFYDKLARHGLRPEDFRA